MEQDIRSLMILLGAQNLLAPSSVVAEVIRYRPPEVETEDSEWISGFITWRDQQIPVLATEKIFNASIKHIAASFDAHIIIFYALWHDDSTGFYGLPVPAMPQTISLNENSFSEHTILSENEESGVFLASTLVDGEKLVYLPDLMKLEEQALSAS